MTAELDTAGLEPIAIVGLAGRFPGAADVDAFWANLRDGVESIRRFTPEELRAAGVPPQLAGDPAYVPAHGALDDIAGFDAAFFGISPRDAALLDPQQRIFLECAWSAIEHAGYDPATVGERFGVVAGAGLNHYLLTTILPRRDPAVTADLYSLFVANDKDFLPTRVSYKLDLRGPSLNVNTACSSSLVAVHVACQLLWSYQCDAALAGGVSLQVPQHAGYLYQPGAIASPDGRCRAFDAAADGTVTGSGAGVVVLKRLADAQAAGDTVYAVIRGSAVNNDGARKAGYTAPGVEGQAAAIAEAAALAGIAPATIGYVEAHGTGTPLGDPIEIAALTQAFGEPAAPATCLLGSVKTNIGHLDAAAGIAGLIKTVLALHHEAIPASLHFAAPNAAIDFAGGPFAVCRALTPWRRGALPRRAGVSSFGIGGTNAHVVLEEAPALPARPAVERPRLFVVSARTAVARDRAIAQLADFAETADARPEDVAWTLATGRAPFRYAAYAVASSCRELAAVLRAGTYVAGEREPTATPLPVVYGPAAAGAAWLAGATPDWPALFSDASPRRVALPTYPFEHTPHWYGSEAVERLAAPATMARRALDDWFFVPGWSRSTPLPSPDTGALTGSWLVVTGGSPLERAIVVALEAAGAAVTPIEPGTTDLAALVAEAERAGTAWDRILHTAAVVPLPAEAVQRTFDELLALVRALAAAGRTVREIAVLTTGLADVDGREQLEPAKALLLGPVAVIPDEFPGTACRCIDLEPGDDHARQAADLVRELAAPVATRLSAWRNGRRWTPGFERLRLPAAAADAQPYRSGGTYLITGGLGGLGLVLAEHLATTAGASLVLTTRRPVPADDGWAAVAPRRASAVAVALPELASEVAAAEQRITNELAIRTLDDRPDLRDAMTALATAYARDYLTGRGALPAAGGSVTRERISAACAVLPEFRRLVDHLLNILAAAGWVRLDGEQVVVLGDAATAVSAAALRGEAIHRFPGFAPLFELLATCAESYPAALSGRIPAIGVLFPDGGRGRIVEAAERIEEHGNHRVYRTLLAEVLERLAQRAARGPLRILEVGGGNAIMTGLIAERLRGLDVEYVFTDIGRSFVLAAEGRARERGYDFMRFAPFDISRDPAPQGFEPGSFDVVIGLDVVHATPSIRETVDNLRALLAPGGLLGLVESARTHPWDDMIWGLAEGWWLFRDPQLRNPNAPLLATARWEAALADAGFSALRAFPEGAAARARTDCSLILAQAGAPHPAGTNGAASGKPLLDTEVVAALRRIRAQAGGLIVRQADVADEAAMASVVAEAEARFGKIDGVFHAAAVEYKALITSRDRPVETTEFRPKVAGTLVLDRLFRERPLDFLVLCSSITGVAGGAGQVGYCAANAFLDAFAARRSRERGELTVSIDWGRWQGLGLARDYESWHAARTGRELLGGMTTAEGLEALRRILAHRIGPQVAVMTTDWDPERSAVSGTAPQPAPAPTAPVPAAAVFDGTEIERQLAEIWRAILGTPTVARDATFQELGGDSLVGIQMIARIREQLGVELPIHAVFDYPTIAELAERVEAAQAVEIEEGAI